MGLVLFVNIGSIDFLAYIELFSQ